jgi:hypothetical protein
MPLGLLPLGPTIRLSLAADYGPANAIPATDGWGLHLRIGNAERKVSNMTSSKKILLAFVGMGAAAMVAVTPATAQQTQKPNILFIMGDDIGWMQPRIYHRGLMVGETPNIDRIGNEGAMFTDYYAEESCTAGRNAFFTGMHPLRTGMIPPQLPGSPSYLRPGTPALAWFTRPRLQHRRVRQEPPGRPHRSAADRARLS